MVHATYQYYKGGTHQKLMEALDTVTVDWVVVHRGQDGCNRTTPRELFYGKVEHEGVMVDRFKLLTSYDL